MPCTYFLQNKCRNGLQCAFSHDAQKVPDPPINNQIKTTTDTAPEKPVVVNVNATNDPEFIK